MLPQEFVAVSLYKKKTL